MISVPERQQIITWVEEARAAGARQAQACQLLGITLRSFATVAANGGIVRGWPQSAAFYAHEQAQ